MKELYIRSLYGEEERVIDFEVSRKNSTSGEKTISVSVLKTDGNQHAYHLIQNQNIFIYENDEYVIKKFREKTKGNTTKCDCQAIHRIVEDLNDNYIYDTVSKTMRLSEMMSFSLQGSGYTFEIDQTGLPLSVEVQNFGDDHSYPLMKSAIDKFGAEYQVSGKHIFVAKQIGRITDYQFRHQYNIKDPAIEIDTNSLKTYIKGFGKKNEDGSYVAQAEYKSPLAEIHGIKHAKPVRDEKYIDNASLLDRIKRELNDSIDIAITLTYVQLEELGMQDIQKGDYVWCIIDPFNIDVRIRVVDVEDFSNPFKPAVYTLGTIKRKASDIIKTSQRDAKKEIADTKTTVVQTQQEVLKVVGDVELNNTNITELKSAVESTNKEVNLLSDKVTKLQISVGDIVVATETQDGLMSKEDKKKLNLIKYTGQVEVDLSILVQKISSLEQSITQLDTRVKALEANKTV